MILDERTEFADGVAVAGAAATRNVGDVVDLGSVVRDIGLGKTLYLNVIVDTAPTGADTVDFKLVSDAGSTPAVDGSASLHWSSGAIAIASLPAGTRFTIPLPIAGTAYERYLGVQATNAGAGALAALVVSAFLTLNPSKNVAYPDAVN